MNLELKLFCEIENYCGKNQPLDMQADLSITQNTWNYSEKWFYEVCTQQGCLQSAPLFCL